MENSAGPTIFRSSGTPLPSSATVKNSGNWFKKNLVKILLVVLGIGVAAELVFGAFTIFSPASVRNLNIMQPDLNQMGGAKFSLVPDKESYKAGDTVVVDVKVFTGGYTTASVDMVLKYDPAFLRPSAQNFVAPGQIYQEYLPVQVDNQEGLIGLSGIMTDESGGFSGVGSFAKISFTALKDGQTEITVDYEANSTSDYSNMVLQGEMKDVLSAVDNATVVISENGASAQAPAGQRCESFTQSCQTSSGAVGTQVCKAGTINQSVCSYDARATTTCEVCVTN